MPLILQEPPAQALAAIDAAVPKLTRLAPVQPDSGPAVVANPRVELRGAAIARGVTAFARARATGIFRDRARAEVAVRASAATPVAAPVHVLGLDELSRGGDLRASRPKLWTHFLNDGEDRPAAVADVDAANFRFASVEEGASVVSLGGRVRALASEEANAPDRELAMIRVPALHLTAIWLKGRAGPQDDVVIPNDGPIAPLEPGRRYALQEFMDIVKPMAAARIAMTTGDLGG
ncbi:hypothetical protein [Sandaracinobacteroides saxicola]|uniref:Uncharacterized protein n=1 Tax=Sandaracinobacteroides saxicola TaxID=2759707 RepID=A0A7G5IEV7_9SPHN|nr:hypothetical protein [Sandaracinobacteroides saxicola]QMW21899.1 hypothetical protein H3309_10940 [Sandaracinobacteroides saxicola]